jgi:hypothetical protein
MELPGIALIKTEHGPMPVQKITHQRLWVWRGDHFALAPPDIITKKPSQHDRWITAFTLVGHRGEVWVGGMSVNSGARLTSLRGDMIVKTVRAMRYTRPVYHVPTHVILGDEGPIFTSVNQ